MPDPLKEKILAVLTPLITYVADSEGVSLRWLADQVVNDHEAMHEVLLLALAPALVDSVLAEAPDTPTEGLADELSEVVLTRLSRRIAALAAPDARI